MGRIIGHVLNNWPKERGLPYVGDDMVGRHMRKMASGPEPLLEIMDLSALSFPYGKVAVTMTQTGTDVLAGRRDWIQINGIDQWLGGVHLHGHEAAWRWDEKNNCLVSARSD